MIDKIRRQTALLVLLKAWRHFGTAAFAVRPGGAHWYPLRDAEKLGWCSFVGDRCRLSRTGVEELAPWRGGEAAD
jgi:hypothetical protein